MSMTLKPNPEKMSFVTHDRNSFNIKEDIWRSKLSGAGTLMGFEIENHNKLVLKEKLQLGVNKDGHLWGRVIIKLADGVDIKKLEYAVTLALKKPGMKSYANPLMMQEPKVKLEQLNKVKNKMSGGHALVDDEEKYQVEGFLKEYLEDGFVTVEVVSKMSMNGDQVDEERSRKVNVVEDISKEWINGETSDFLLVCGDTQFHCHKTILSARSPVFASGIAKMKEGVEERWVVKESTPEAVWHMLMFIHTGEIYYDDILKRPLEMLQLATFYQLHDLAAASRDMLLWQITAENALLTLVNMDRYDETEKEAKQQVIKLIKKNARNVVGSKDWDVFQANHGSLVKEVMEAIREEIEEFKAKEMDASQDSLEGLLKDLQEGAKIPEPSEPAVKAAKTVSEAPEEAVVKKPSVVEPAVEEVPAEVKAEPMETEAAGPEALEKAKEGPGEVDEPWAAE